MIKLADFCKAGLPFVETQFSPYLSTASIFLQLLETSLSQTRLDGVSLITTLARPLNQTHCIDDCGAVLSSRTTCAPIHTTLKDATGRQLYLATNFPSPERHHSKIVSTTENQPPAIPRLLTFDVRKVVQQFREVTESRQQSSNDCKLTTLLRFRIVTHQASVDHGRSHAQLYLRRAFRLERSFPTSTQYFHMFRQACH
jgi:hypothetical protein